MSLFQCRVWQWGGWFRIFGKGLAFHPSSEGLRFSERYGYTRYMIIGPLKIKVLT